jgi:hypothetical protein
MAENRSQQGTGKHPHKSSEEPYPPTKDSAQGGKGQGGQSRQQASGSSRSEGGGEKRQQASSGSQGGSQGSSRSEGKGQERQQASGPDDLKQREYRDEQGNIHHHTHTYMEQHKGEGGGGGSRQS